MLKVDTPRHARIPIQSVRENRLDDDAATGQIGGTVLLPASMEVRMPDTTHRRGSTGDGSQEELVDLHRLTLEAAAAHR